MTSDEEPVMVEFSTLTKEQQAYCTWRPAEHKAKEASKEEERTRLTWIAEARAIESQDKP